MYIEGLGGLSRINGKVEIHDNASLTTLYGLRNLEEIGGQLYVQRNPQLTELGLEFLVEVGGEGKIMGNENLCDSVVDALSTAIGKSAGAGKDGC